MYSQFNIVLDALLKVWLTDQKNTTLSYFLKKCGIKEKNYRYTIVDEKKYMLAILKYVK